MKKRLLAALFAAMAMLAGCAGETAPPEPEPPESAAASAPEESEPEGKPGEENVLESTLEGGPDDAGINSPETSSPSTENVNQTPQIYGAEEAAEYSLEGGPSWIYNDVYNTIDGMLIYYIGSGRFDDWVKNTDTPHNMQTCVEEFDLTADEVVAALTAGGEPLEISGLTEAEIGTLCSGDQAAINRAFASDFAAVSESGSIYTIFWLGTHTADDYRAAGLSAEAVRAAADSCMELGIESVNPYIAAAKSALGGMDGS